MNMFPRAALVAFRRLALSAGLLALWAAAGPSPVSSNELAATHVKAAFLYNFARFTEWPADAFPSPSAPFVIGIAGDEETGRAASLVMTGKSVGGRPVRVRLIENPQQADEVRILYLTDRADVTAGDWLKALAGRPVLTVGDMNGFCASGGMIEFLIEDNRLRFEVDLSTTERAGLKLSSRVLALAKAIHGKN